MPLKPDSDPLPHQDCRRPEKVPASGIRRGKRSPCDATDIGGGGCGGDWNGGGVAGTGGGRKTELLRAADSRVGRQLRRELIHRLASAPCTHSDLQDACHATSHSETLESEVTGYGWSMFGVWYSFFFLWSCGVIILCVVSVRRCMQSTVQYEHEYYRTVYSCVYVRACVSVCGVYQVCIMVQVWMCVGCIYASHVSHAL